MPPVSVSSCHHKESHLTQTKIPVHCRHADMSATSDMVSLSASHETFDFFSAYSDPFLNDAAYVSPQSLINNDSFPFLNGSIPNGTVFDHPISAFIAYSPPALYSYSAALSSATPLVESPSTSRYNVLADSRRSSPKTPISSRAYPPLFHKSPTKLPSDSPPFSFNDSPFRTLVDTTLPSLIDPCSSPVVRRSQGDITPLFGRGGEIIYVSHVSNQPKRCCDIPHQSARADTDTIERSPDSHSPALERRSTPFLQRLRRLEDSLSPSTDTDPALPLASPFTFKVESTQSAFAGLASTACTTTATHAAPAEREIITSKLCAHTVRRLLGVDCSPLSEASSTTPPRSPITSDLQCVFENEDQTHRMNTRSRSKARLSKSSSQSASKPSAFGTPKRRSKRKCPFRDEIDNDNGMPTDSDSDMEICSLTKRKTHGGMGSLAKRTAVRRESMSRGAGVNNTSPTNKSIEVNISTPVQFYSIPISNSDQAHLALGTTLPSGSSTSESQRTFHSTVPINPMFPMFYRQFPISSFFYPDGRVTSILADKNTKAAPASQINQPRDPYDLYTPRFTRGIGKSKLGLCPICFESIHRGGADNAEWLAMKVSAYKCYHMQYAHGISPATGLPFSPPIAFRTASRPASEVRKQEKTELMQGKCHKCHKWAAIEGVKTGEVKVKELFWWKHAASCHKSSIIEGEGNAYSRDNVFHRLQQYERRTKLTSEDNMTEND